MYQPESGLVWPSLVPRLPSFGPPTPLVSGLWLVSGVSGLGCLWSLVVSGLWCLWSLVGLWSLVALVSGLGCLLSLVVLRFVWVYDSPLAHPVLGLRFWCLSRVPGLLGASPSGASLSRRRRAEAEVPAEDDPDPETVERQRHEEEQEQIAAAAQANEDDRAEQRQVLAAQTRRLQADRRAIDKTEQTPGSGRTGNRPAEHQRRTAECPSPEQDPLRAEPAPTPSSGRQSTGGGH